MPFPDVKKVEDCFVMDTVVNKEKRKKKRQVTITEHGSVDNGSSEVVKKGKKKKKGEKEKWVKGSPNGHGCEEKNHGKKKEIVAGTENGSNTQYTKVVNGNEKRSSKKKKRLAEKEAVKTCEENAEEASVNKEEISISKHKKQKKTKDKSVQTKPVEECVAVNEENERDELLKKHKKTKTNALASDAEVSNKKKKKKSSKSNELTEEEMLDELDTNNRKKAKKEMTRKTEKLLRLKGEGDFSDMLKKKTKDKSEHKTVIKTTSEEAGAGEIHPKKKKKKKKKGALEQEEFDDVNKEEIREKAIEHKRSESSGCAVVDDEGKLQCKKKEMKAQKRRVSLQTEGEASAEPKKKKRKKTSSKGEDDRLVLPQQTGSKDAGQNTDGVVFVPCDSKSTEKKGKTSSTVERTRARKEKEVTNGSCAKKKKKKIKVKVDSSEEQGFPVVDVVFVSEKTGNIDEVTINQERRLALQMDIDNASNTRSPANKPSSLGQWSTAQFNNSEQQNKFLRLMGGFKKGALPSGPSASQANMALGEEQQQSLQHALLGEFERAQSRRMDFTNRGAGLGFAAPSNKKFSIDASARRSIRLDD